VDQAESRDFVEAILDNEPNRLGVPFREMLYRQTRGQPLFTIELLRGMQERGDLVQDQGGQLVEGPALDWETLPARVEAVIAERIGRLAQPLRAAMRVASVEGEVFTAEVVARVLGIDERKLVQRLSRELDRRHRLVRVQAIKRLGSRRVSRYRFRHYLCQKYLYDNLDEVERVYLHEDVGDVLEELYDDQPQEIATIAPQLARHFQEARIAEKAIHYLHLAGEKAVQLSAYQEARVHLTSAMTLLMTLPDSPERAEQELALHTALGLAWIGYPGSERENACTRALELCRQTGNTSQLCRVLGDLSIIHYVRAEHQKARELAEEALSLAQDTEDPLLVALGHWYLGFVLFFLGEYTTAQSHFELMIAFYEPQQHHQPFVFLRGVDAGVSAMGYVVCCLWCLGYPDQALSRSQQALALARDLGHPFTLADVLCFAGCSFNAMHRDATVLKDNAEELEHLSNETVQGWLGTGNCHKGEALVMLGQVQDGMAQIREGIAVHQSFGIRLNLPGTLRSLAEAQAKAGHPEEGLATMDEALALVEETDERLWEAELYRLRGELLLMQGDDVEAEISLKKAIEVARRQSAKSWELRASTSLARLWQKQGKVDEAGQMLGEIYGWFSEGFDTPDLRETKALLEEFAEDYVH
jgi:tetratricopeptide (TPR) repeat protein